MLLVSSKFSTSNLVFTTVDLEDFEYFKDSPVIDCGIIETEVESPNIVYRKKFYINNSITIPKSK